MKLTAAYDWLKDYFSGNKAATQLAGNQIDEINRKKVINYSYHSECYYYTDSIGPVELIDIDTKWQSVPPAPSMDVAVSKISAPGSITVQQAKQMVADSSPALANSPEIAKMLDSDNLEEKIKRISTAIDEELKKPNRDFQKLQSLIYLAVLGLMHKYKKVDQEYILESGAQIKIQAVKVQGTYNTWPAVTITILSSVVGVVGGVAGLAPLAPISWINAETARVFAGASQSIGTAGTGLGGVGSIFNSKGESVRFVYQIDLEEIKKKREDKEGAKHQKAQRGNEARSNLHEHDKNILDLIRSILAT